MAKCHQHDSLVLLALCLRTPLLHIWKAALDIFPGRENGSESITLTVIVYERSVHLSMVVLNLAITRQMFKRLFCTPSNTQIHDLWDIGIPLPRKSASVTVRDLRKAGWWPAAIQREEGLQIATDVFNVFVEVCLMVLVSIKARRDLSNQFGKEMPVNTEKSRYHTQS